ncbi:hypothetical protein PAAG_02154 [Paracoccidioides lutzii Pb01]|uniref:Uncharacterized protein n=1 Tax=Paracoccidioides lutzii (strain ATCC MYA-826 / Pb01) TaxID=502779 RepID=C1GUF9_PARBA|nr:hypothetical protein PAAG_02154 [Paracoccidioides lutzii Pb01]EEH39965.2 hypothetical protein PAAG_02154 [Paracoccidioides lutzii Pb01]
MSETCADIPSSGTLVKLRVTCYLHKIQGLAIVLVTPPPEAKAVEELSDRECSGLLKPQDLQSQIANSCRSDTVVGAKSILGSPCGSMSPYQEWRRGDDRHSLNFTYRFTYTTVEVKYDKDQGRIEGKVEAEGELIVAALSQISPAV